MDFLSVLEIIVVVICAITYGFMLSSRSEATSSVR